MANYNVHDLASKGTILHQFGQNRRIFILLPMGLEKFDDHLPILTYLLNETSDKYIPVDICVPYDLRNNLICMLLLIILIFVCP